MKIGLIIGSLRKESYNRKIAHLLKERAPKTLDLSIIEIDKLSFFNQDEEANPPSSWVKFREEIHSMDGFIFITPEYNRSLPAVLKNAIDIGSRPYGQSQWNNKPCAIISASVGAIGGFGANHQLRQAMVFLNMPCMQQPEVYLSFVDKLFDDNGKMNNEGTKAFLEQFLDKFATWVRVNKTD